MEVGNGVMRRISSKRRIITAVKLSLVELLLTQQSGHAQHALKLYVYETTSHSIGSSVRKHRERKKIQVAPYVTAGRFCDIKSYMSFYVRK